MWWKTISRQRPNPVAQATAFDEAFLRRLERLAITASRTLRGGLSGTHASQRRLPAPAFSDHRPYASSDDLRYVDWNAYARQEHLFVKLGETEQDVPIHVVLDRSASMDYGVGDTHKLQRGKQLMAALGYIALANGDMLHATTADTTTAQAWGPARSKQRASDLLRYAAAITPSARGALQPALESYTRARSGGVLVIVSDGWALGDLQALLRVAAPPRWQVLLLHLLHRDELQPQLHGNLELEDSETHERTALLVDDQLLDQYQARVAAWCRTIETTCHQRGAAYARIVTDMPLEQAVLPYLHQRLIIK
jgi:uncharacterized protein (DUF58 family)